MTHLFQKAIASVLFLAATVVAHSQTNIKSAISDFDAGNYDAAIAALEASLDRNERDPKTNYYLGAAYVCANRNVSEGLRRLKFAQIKGFMSDSHLYLGRAYQLIFEFERAIESFDRFLKTAKDERLIAKAQQYRAESVASIGLTNKLFDVRVIDKYRIMPDSLLSVYNPSKEVGMVQRNSDFFESDIDPNGVLYRTERGDAVYFSLPNGQQKEKLYKIERLLDGWGDMQPLDGLSSEGNDKMPVMMTDGTTLYFSSDRAGGMGGFDIYRTVYDSETRTFTEPVNLGVPFNSAFDDYLFVGDEFRKRAWFTSNRETHGDSIMVYEILWDDSVIRNFAQSVDEIRRASALQIDPTLADMRDDIVLPGIAAKQSFSITKEMKKFEFDVNDTLTYTQWEHFRSEAAKQAYEKAFGQQNVKDSLSNEMAKKRKEFMELKTDDERNEIIAEILAIERNVYAMEDQLADMYENVRRLENAKITELVNAGEYVPLKQIEVKARTNDFDWGELLVPEKYEMFSLLVFDEARENNSKLYATVFDPGTAEDLQLADSLFAWGSVLALEATKLSERSMTSETVVGIDENGKTTELSPTDLARKAEMLHKAAVTLYNNALDQKFDIFEDRYDAAVEAEPAIDFDEVAEYKNSAEHDFGLVDKTSLADGIDVFEKAVVMKKRGMAMFTDGMKRYADHLDGTFPLPQKGQRAEPQSVVMAMTTTTATTTREPAAERRPNVTPYRPEPQPEPEPAKEEPAPAAQEPQPTTQAATTAPAVADATKSPADGKPVYRIQLGVFRNKPDHTKLQNLPKISSLYLPESGLTKYFCGEFPTYAEAIKNLDNVKQSGFSGAFVVAFAGGEQIKLSQAQKME